jgi:hypothetical protein
MSKKINKVIVYRQGDVSLLPVDINLNAGAEEVKESMKGKTVLALGEVTGHYHSIPATKAKQFKVGSKEYVKVTKPAQLTHQEHFPINLPIGTYEKVIAREYDKVGGERKVID